MIAPDHPGGEVWNAVLELLTWADVAERIKRLHRHDALRERADKLMARFTARTTRGADDRLLHDIQQAETHAERMDVASVVAAHANLGAPGKTRVKRAPQIDAWIAADVERYRKSTNKERWRRAPADVHAIGLSGFMKRVGAAKKAILRR